MADYRILIIFGTTILDTTCHQTLFKFPLHPTYASALPEEIKTHDIGIKMLLHYLRETEQVQHEIKKERKT